MKATIIGRPRPRLAAPPTPAMSSTCDPVSAPTPWIIPTPKAVRTPYELISTRFDMLVAVQPCLETPPGVAEGVEDEHPAAAQPKLVSVAGVLVEREEDPPAEHDEGDAHDAAHDRVDPCGQDLAEEQRRAAEDRHHEGVAQRIQRAQQDGAPLFGEEAAARQPLHVLVLAREVLAAVRLELARPPMRVRNGSGGMVLGVTLLGCLGGGRGARDVDDCRDVVPVDPVPDAEQQCRDEQRPGAGAGGQARAAGAAGGQRGQRRQADGQRQAASDRAEESHRPHATRPAALLQYGAISE